MIHREEDSDILKLKKGQFVVCSIKPTYATDITVGKSYEVVSSTGSELMIISDNGFQKIISSNKFNYWVGHIFYCYKCESKDLNHTEYKCNDCGHNGYYD